MTVEGRAFVALRGPNGGAPMSPFGPPSAPEGGSPPNGAAAPSGETRNAPSGPLPPTGALIHSFTHSLFTDGLAPYGDEWFPYGLYVDEDMDE